MNVALINLTSEHCRELVSATVMHAKLPGVLARFEVELLWELSERCLKHDLAATATADEWKIVEDCLVSLRAELGKRRIVADGLSIQLVANAMEGAE